MSLAIKYENAHDAQMRLRGTVVLYEGSPVYIREIREGDGDSILRVMFDHLPITVKGVETAAKRKFISSKNFDIAPFKLGYVNAPTGAFYCTRFPNRVQKQGLCSENFSAKTNNGKDISFGTFTTTKEVVAMVNGDYPTFDVALRALGKSPAVAFSRDFCVQKDEILDELVHIYHRGEKVGARLNNSVVLGKKFQCLKEGLGELGVKVS